MLEKKITPHTPVAFQINMNQLLKWHSSLKMTQNLWILIKSIHVLHLHLIKAVAGLYHACLEFADQGMPETCIPNTQSNKTACFG